MHAKYEVRVYFLWLKIMAKVIVILATNRQTHNQTGKELDASKFHSGDIKICL